MGEAFWAAREGDALLHSSFMADLIGGVLELAANVVVGAIALGATAAALGVTVASLGCGTVLAVGMIVGVAMAVSGAGKLISEWSEKIGNWLAPPTIQGYILTGSPDTRINSKPAARAAATALPRQAIEEMVAQRQAEQEQAEREAQEKSLIDTAGEYLNSALQTTRNLAQKASTLDGLQDIGSGILFGTGDFISEMWRPTVARAFPGAEPRDTDKIDCHKHPGSLSNFAKQQISAMQSNPLGFADSVLFNPLGVLEKTFQAVDGLLGSANRLWHSLTGQEQPEVGEYLAEGARDVRVNSQPAARSNVRSTCEATVVEEPAEGQHVSSDVRIGGPLLVVRDIRSGKSPVALVAGIVMAFMRPGKMMSKISCYLQGIGFSILIQKAAQALPKPVHAATGAKYLAGQEELDFTLPGHLPLAWQRVYNSRDLRTDGLHGPGWSVACEVALEKTPDNADQHAWTYIDELGRRLEMQAVAPGEGFYSPGEGLAVRRSREGHWLVTRDDGIHRLFEPDPFNPQRQRLVQWGDHNLNRLNLQYDEQGRLAQIADEQGRLRLLLHYHAQHSRRLICLERQRPDGQHEVLNHYHYDSAGRLACVQNHDRQPLRHFAYDANHCMIMHQLPAGERCHYRWAWCTGPDDAAWRVVEHWTDSGEHYHLDWHLADRRLNVTDSLGRQSCHQWNAQGQVIRYQDPLGHTSHFRWNEERLLLGMTDAQGGRWRYVYDRQGHLTETHDPLGRVEQTQWHAVWHQPLVEVDAAGNTWRHDYDERGNRIATIDPHQQRTGYQYDRHGQPLRITDAQGGHSTLRWNEDGQLIRHTDCSGCDSAWFYDERGQLEHTTNAAGESSAYRYNPAGQLIGTVYPDGRSEHYTLDAAGQLTGLTDAAGRTLNVTYDAYGRMTALTNENGECYRFCYDANDRLIEQTELDGRKQQRRYNALDHLTAVCFAADSPARIEHVFQRDAAGRLIAKHTAEGCTTYRYDHTDNLLEVVFNRPGQAEGTAPDLLSFSYDKLGRCLSETSAQGTLRHDYDALGNGIRTRLPDGRAIKHLYYGSGHLSQINLDSETISAIERDRLHREILRTQGVLNTRRDFDRAGRISRLQTAHGKNGIVPNTLIDRHYQYDHLDQLLTRRHSRQGRTDYYYGLAGRITGCRHEAYWDTLHYDAAANLLDTGHHTGHADPPPATPAGNVVRFNRLLHFRRHHYQYDAHGRTASKRSPGSLQRYHYDAEHRLVRVEIEQGGSTRTYGYVYDALGRRIEKHQVDSQGGVYNRTRFLWDGLRLVQEARPEGSQSLYLYADQDSHEPLARVDSRGTETTTGNVYYFHTDLNGAPETLTDSAGQVVWETHYQLWGNTLQESYAETDSTPIPQNLRYQGQYFDRETGLHYNTFRYYDPDIGRFTTPDPIGLAGGINLYSYAPNPLTWIDPLGLSCSLSGKKIKKGDGTDLVTIPDNAKVRKLTPPEGYSGDYGYEYKWTNSGGGTTTVRIHGPDALAPPGSNASNGWVVRIMDGKKSMDINGVYHPPGIFNPNSPSYNPSAINDVHIPITKPTSFPGVD